MKNIILKAAILTILLLGLPMAGIQITGKPVAQYLEFPPQTLYVPHAPFSWPIFFLMAPLPILVCGPFLFFILQKIRKRPLPEKSFSFPVWGHLGLLIILSFWIVAWNRFSWFKPFQAYTFLPLWLGYILVINALSFKRLGFCLLTARPRFFLSLFPLSALFWWYFEYLNRFVQNWYYLGIENFSPGEYIIHATLCFSTVLPAVLSTEEWLSSHAALTKGLNGLRPIHIKRPILIGWTALALSCAGLLGIGVWPDFLYPLLWISPLIIITATQAIQGEETIFSCIRHGDWRRIWLPAFAALTCGFFWEMWNFKSFAHWEYSVPFVQRFHIFHMPLLGYAGYLPFGLECAIVAGLLRECPPDSNR